MKPTAAGSLGQKPTAAFLACLAFVTALTAACIARPLYNWDMLAYMATALAYRDADSVRVHREVYDALRAVAPPAKLEPLIGPVPHPYREDVYRNADHFTQQIPFYSVKPALPFLIFLLGLTGMNLATASIAVAAVGYGAACLLLFAWLRASRVPPWASLVATAILALGPPFVMLGRIATPDSLYLALFVLSGLLLLERRRPHAAMLVLLAAMLARPNGIIWYGMVGFYLTFLAPPDLRISRAACGAYAVASFALFEVLQITSGNYPWTVHFHHSWIEHLPSPATFVPTLTLPDYLRFYVARIPYLLAGELPFFVLLALAGFLARRALGVAFRDDVPAHFLLASIPFFVLHWALYPGQLDRMYAPQYWLIAGIALAAAAVPREARAA